MQPDFSLPQRQQSFLQKIIDTLPEESSLNNLLHRFILTDSMDALKQHANPERVNQLIDHTITPLHAATMMNNQQAAEILVETDTGTVNARDDRGATPLFHAAIAGNRVLVQYLLDSKADADCYPGVNAHQILTLSYPQSHPLPPPILYQEGKRVTTKSVKDFEDMTGAAWLDDHFILPDVWHERWLNFYNPHAIRPRPSAADAPLLALYREFRSQSEPMVVMKRDPQMGFYLCAHCVIPQGRIVEEYLSELSDLPLTAPARQQAERDDPADDEQKFLYRDRGEKEYEVEGFLSRGVEYERKNSYKKRNLASQINCSFPNLLCYKIYTIEGVLERVLFISNTRIKKGEPLTFDYGSPVKLGPYIEMRPKQMAIFFRSKSLETLRNYLPRASYPDDLTERLTSLGEESKLTYLLTTPTAMFTLVYKNVLSIETVDTLFQEFHGYSEDEAKMRRHYSKTYQGCFLLELKKLVNNKPLWKKHRRALYAMLGQTPLIDLYLKIKAINQSEEN